jgi:hypothetical protein
VRVSIIGDNLRRLSFRRLSFGCRRYFPFDGSISFPFAAPHDFQIGWLATLSPSSHTHHPACFGRRPTRHDPLFGEPPGLILI